VRVKPAAQLGSATSVSALTAIDVALLATCVHCSAVAIGAAK